MWIAQLVERQVVLRVAGSSPVSHPKLKIKIMFWFIYKITLVVIVMIIIAVYFKNRELFKSQIFNLFTTGEFIILLTPIINTLLIIYGVYRAIQITTKNDRE